MYIGMRDVPVHRTVDEPMAFLRENGISKLEVRVDPDMMLRFIDEKPHSVENDDKMEEAIAYLKENGIQIAGILLNTEFAEEAGDIAHIKGSAAFARKLGVETLRIDFKRPEPESDKVRAGYESRARKRLEAYLPVAVDSGVSLALENHAHMTNRPYFLRELADEFHDKGLRVCFDTGNFYITGGVPLDEIYELAEYFAPVTTVMHVKNASYPENVRNIKRNPEDYPFSKYAMNIEGGDIDHKKLLNIFLKAGYKGGAFYEDEVVYNLNSIENQSLKGKNPEDVMARTLNYLKEEVGLDV